MNQHLLLLFSFDLLPFAFVSQLDPRKHILLDEPAPGTFKVVKNAQTLHLLFSHFEKLGLMPVCYSHKKYSLLAPVLKKVNQNLKWIYINNDKNLCPHLLANQARLHKLEDGTNLIEYGEGFSACQGKEELRMAICSAFRMSLEQGTKRIIIYENNTQQLTKLKQNGYQYVFAQIPKTEKLAQHFEQLQKIWFEQKNENNKNDKQFQQFVIEAPSLEDSWYVNKIANFHYFENKKNIALSSGLGFSNSPPSYRLPRSMSVCSIVFRYLGDKQIYVGKSDVTSKIGGDVYYQGQEDKVMASCLYQTITNFRIGNHQESRVYMCLPMYISHFTMKHCLVKSYNKNKGCFVVRPYVKNLKTISEFLTPGKQQDELMQLSKNGIFHNKAVKGLGNIIALGLVMNEEFTYKGLAQTISLYSQRKSLISDHNMKNKEKQLDYWHCCKIDFMTCFKRAEKVKQNISQIQIKLTNSPQISIRLSQLHHEYINQIKQTLLQLNSNMYMFQSLFSHQVWNYNKESQLQSFKQLVTHYHRLFGLPKVSDQIKIKDFCTINPKFLNILVANDIQQRFDYFTKNVKDQSYQMYGFGLDHRNLYQQMMSLTENFIIFGQSVPIISLIKWIKSVKNNTEIMYITLLHHKKQYFEKQLKLAKSQKKNIMFIIDHCQVQQAGGDLPEGKSITDLNWGLRTIFIYRIKLGTSKKLKVLHDPLTNGGSFSVSAGNSKLANSKQQVFNTIFQLIPKDHLKQGLFDYYDKAISLYITNKWITLGLKMGVRDLDILKSKLRLIVKAISLKTNRLISLLKDKELNNFKLEFQESQQLDYDSMHPASLRQDYRYSTCQTGLGNGDSEGKNLQHLKDVPRAQLILYCLPIFIVNQRIWLHNDIYQYLSAFYLFESVIRGDWTGNLEGEELRNFQKWYPFMHQNQKQQIKNSLMKLVLKFSKLKSEQTGFQIMGRNSNLSDCLQLMRRVGIEQIFCKLDTMFYLDSTVNYIYGVGKEKQRSLVMVTKKGSVHKIVKQNIEGKQVQKAVALYQKLDENKKSDKEMSENNVNIGAFQFKDADNKWMIFTFANSETANGKIQIKQGSLSMVQIWIKDNSVVKHPLQIKLGNFAEHLQKRKATILKLSRIQCSILIMVLNDGNVIAAKINKILPSLAEKEELVQLIFFQQIKNTAWHRLEVPQTVLEEERDQKKERLQFDQNGFISIAMIQEECPNEHEQQSYVSIGAVCKKQSMLISSDANAPIYPIGVTQFRLIAGQKAEIEIKESMSFQLRAANKVKSLSLNFNLSSSNKVELDILATQIHTDILNLWTINDQLPPNSYTFWIEPHRRFYQIQSEPTTIYKHNNTIYVASKHAFAKKMLIPPRQSQSKEETGTLNGETI